MLSHHPKRDRKAQVPSWTAISCRALAKDEWTDAEYLDNRTLFCSLIVLGHWAPLGRAVRG